MKKRKPLSYKELHEKLNISELRFKSTREVKSSVKFIGHQRAVSALQFGISIKRKGYNLYAMGPSGIGKFSLINLVLAQHVKKLPAPDDWCYIYNFSAPEKPIALQLPAGMGVVFQQDMKKMIEELGASVLSVFESDEYQSGMKRINDFFERKRKKNNKTPKSEKVPPFYKEKHEKEKKLQVDLVSQVVHPIVNKLKKKFKKFSDVVNYLDAVEIDILSHVNEFIKKDEETDLFSLILEDPVLTKYKINLLVDNSNLKNSPIIIEENPVYPNLICRIEHTSQHGTLTTNFSLIRAGSLLKANGGFLIIEMRKLSENREAWEALKSALYSEKVNWNIISLDDRAMYKSP